MRGFSQTPRTHSLAQAGAYPDLPVLRLSNRRVHVVAAPEERTEQGDLRFRRRCLIDRPRDQVHELLSLQPLVEDCAYERLVQIEAGRLESFEQIGHVHQALFGT